MNRRLRRQEILLCAVLVTVPVVAPAAEFKDAAFSHVDYPAWFVDDPFLDLAELAGRASSTGKQGIMILYTTEGCSYCARFIQKSLNDPLIGARVQKEFESVGLEIFSDNELTDPGGKRMPTKEFARQDGAGFSPTLTFYGPDGRRIARYVGYLSPQRFTAMLDYVGGETRHGESLSEYFRRTAVAAPSAVPMRDDALFASPPHALDRSRFPASRPLLILFEKPGCTECEAFHDEVLALPEVRAALGQFEIVRLDAGDTATPVLAPDGSRTNPADLYRRADFGTVPALLFFDERGNEVLKTDALVRRIRMINSINFVLERAYEKDWTYQRFARSKAIERNLKKQQTKP